jgi:NAD(P)-dependent dehydrogenase (short-subunit alcohol dehydrogenase family)
MLRHGGGAFVSVSSTSAAVACQGLPAYSASKAALEALSRQVCADYGAAGIRSNVIRLGSMVVPGNAALHDDEAFHEASLAQVLVPRLGDPTDLANAVVFLASAESSYATASVLTLDGGASAFLATPNVATAWRHIVE